MTDPAALPSASDLPQGVAITRIANLLVRDGWTLEGETGTLRRRWPQLEIAITMQRSDGLLLLFRGSRLGDPIPLARRQGLEAFANDWHRSRIWPTIVVTTTESDVVAQTHVGIDVTAGLTTAQLDDYLRIGIGTTQQFFQTLRESPILQGPPGAGGASADPEAG
jgi:hypothetical protein